MVSALSMVHLSSSYWIVQGQANPVADLINAIAIVNYDASVVI